jgi:hypothetical protein
MHTVLNRKKIACTREQEELNLLAGSISQLQSIRIKFIEIICSFQIKCGNREGVLKSLLLGHFDLAKNQKEMQNLSKNI